MIVKYRKRILKELIKLPTKIRIRIEKFVFQELPNLNSITDSGKIEKMHGYEGYYKMRFGQYRVGSHIENETIIFERVLHRKDIYRFFS